MAAKMAPSGVPRPASRVASAFRAQIDQWVLYEVFLRLFVAKESLQRHLTGSWAEPRCGRPWCPKMLGHEASLPSTQVDRGPRPSTTRCEPVALFHSDALHNLSCEIHLRLGRQRAFGAGRVRWMLSIAWLLWVAPRGSGLVSICNRCLDCLSALKYYLFWARYLLYNVKLRENEKI